MTRVLLLCGGTGAGKTTYAQRWEVAGGGVRLSIDEWMLALHGDGLLRTEFDAKMAALKTQQLEIVRQLVPLGVEVMLDWGFWKAEERQRVGAQLRGLGAKPIVVWLDVSPRVAWRNLQVRNAAAAAGEYLVTPDMWQDFWAAFEPPSAAEGLEVLRVE